MRIPRPLVACLVAACGPDFSGTFTGGLSIAGTCSDGSGGTKTANVEWAIADDGGELRITPDGGNCGSFTADAEGNTASIHQKTCPASTGASGNTTTETITGGTLTLNGEAITVAMDTNAQITGPSGSGTCRYVTSGTLSR